MENREIEFRFWDKDLNKMCFRKPAYNDFSHKNIIPLEFIGITDQKGVKIYEGDYLVDTYPVDEADDSKGTLESLLPVVYCSKQLTWCVDVSFDKDGGCLNSLVEYFGEHLEVKGNVYENALL